MALIPLPADPMRFSDARFALMRADAILELLGGATQATVFGYALWKARWTLPQQAGIAFGEWRAALVQLSSYANTFEMGPPEYEGPATGYNGAAPVVAGGGQGGLSLDVDGLAFNTDILAAGDYFSVIVAGARELKCVTENVSSDGGGAATIAFEPALRGAPADDAAVEIFAPKTAFRLTTPEGGWDVSHLKHGGVGFEAMEAFAP